MLSTYFKNLPSPYDLEDVQPYITKNVPVVETTLISFALHRQFDQLVRDELNLPEYTKLKNPHEREDYLELVQLIMLKTPHLREDAIDSDALDRLKKIYFAADTPEAVWVDFKAMMDGCLKYGKFRIVRMLGE